MAAPQVPCLVLPSDGRRFPLSEGLTAGRAQDNGVCIEDSSVSTHHAVFHQVTGMWTVKDLNSTNGTWLNGARIQGTATLSEGDSLKLGAVALKLEGLASARSEFKAASPPPLPASALPPPLPVQPPQRPFSPPPLPLPVAAPPPLPAHRPPASRSSHTGLWIALGACFVLLAGGAWFLWTSLSQGGNLRGVLAFRENAGRDPRAAFAEVRAPGKLADLNSVMWPTVEPEAGWTYFFRTCLVTGGARDGNRQAVLFYHPWSDIALVTQWEDQDRLREMEMVPGEALRKGGIAPYGGAMGWTRLNAYAPPAVGMVTAQTLKAFEKAFATEAAVDKALPWLARGQAREACRMACSLQFAQVVKSLVAFSASYDQPARLAFIRLLAQGGNGLGAARGTPPESARALRELPNKAWSGFQPTALIETEVRVLVMAHHRESPDLFLGVVFHRDGAELIPERMDLLSFKDCYGALK